jgi:hypothetical protein
MCVSWPKWRLSNAGQMCHEYRMARGTQDKNAAAVALGRLGGLKGGNARARKLTADERTASARKCHRQPCQKQPSTKTARRARRKMKSGRPGSGWWRRQPTMWAARKMEASFSSVALLPRERTAAMTWLRFCLVNTSATEEA